MQGDDDDDSDYIPKIEESRDLSSDHEGNMSYYSEASEADSMSSQDREHFHMQVTDRTMINARPNSNVHEAGPSKQVCTIALGIFA